MKKLYSSKEAADFLGISVITLKRYRKSGKLKPVSTRINGYSEYSYEQLVSFKKVVSTGISEPVSTSITSISQTSITDTTFAKVVSQPVSTRITSFNQTSITDTTDTGFISPDTTSNPYQDEPDTSFNPQNSYQPVSPKPVSSPIDTTSTDTTLDKPVSENEDKKNSVLTGDGDHKFSSNYIENYNTKKHSLTIPEAIVQQINAISPEELAAHSVIYRAKTIGDQQSYVCPTCNNGTGEDATGIVPNFQGSAWLYHCFKCDASFNNIQLLALHYSLDKHTEFKEICRRACFDFGIYLETPTANDVAETSEKTQLLDVIRNDISFAQEHLEELPESARRGLSLDILRHFGCGFFKDWTSAQSRIKGKFSTPTPRLIIPSGNHYLARLIVPIENYDEKLRIQPKQHIGSKFPFAFDSISNTAPMNIIVEGEIDAMSIWQALHGKVPVIATSGAGAYKSFIKLVKEKYGNSSQKPKFLILFDPDTAGRDAAPKFANELLESGFQSVFHFLSNEVSKLDANDILREQGADILAADIENICNQAEREFEEIKEELHRLDDDIDFIISPSLRHNFAKLRKQPYSKERNEEMIQIIRDNLDWKVNKKGGRQYILPTAKNFHNIFIHDPVISKLFGYEEFKGETVFLKQAFWRKVPCVHQEWTDSDDANLRIYIRQNYADLHSQLTTDDMLTVIAHQNSFNIAQNYFKNLPRWDGTPRAEKLFIDFLDVEDSEFSRAVTFKWLLAAVSRLFYPACNFQSALVLQGNQNIGKSYILEQLGGAFYGCLIDNVEDNHAVDALRNFWICEIKELAAARRAEINAVKSFIERPMDHYRAAYARRAQTFKRHCVFAITVNDKQFLRDLTGNRRYWILQSPLAEFRYKEGLTDDYIQQIWAEVFAKFKELTADGFNPKILELPLELKQHAEKVADKFTVNDGLQSEISAFLDIPILPLILWNVLTLAEKKKFFLTNSIELSETDWKKRRRYIPPDKLDDYQAALDNEKFTTRTKKFEETYISVYGSSIRTETCASEIYNEFSSGGDKRKQILRINEALGLLDGWKLSEKRNVSFNGYGDQKNIFKRIKPFNIESIINTDDINSDDDDVDVPF